MIDDRVFTEVDDEVEDLGGETTVDLPPFEPQFGTSVIKDEEVVYYEDETSISDYYKYSDDKLVFFLETFKSDGKMILNKVIENTEERYRVEEIEIEVVKLINPRIASQYEYVAKQGDTDNLFALIPK